MTCFKRLTDGEARTLTRGELLDRVEAEQKYWARKHARSAGDRAAGSAMISARAGQALSLLASLETCRQTDVDFWKGVVARIVYDMDEVADERGLCTIVDLLSDMWNKLPPKQEAAP